MNDRRKYFPGPASQFRLRHILIVLTFAAIALAIGAPYLRALSAAQWRYLAIIGAEFLAGGVGMGLLTHFTFRAAMRKAGAIRHSGDVVKPLQRAVTYALFILGPAQVLLIVAPGFSDPTETPPPSVMFLLMAVSSGVLTVMPWLIRTTFVAWVGEAGMVVGAVYYPWHKVSVVKTDNSDVLDLQLRWGGTFRVRFASADGLAFVIKHANTPVKAMDRVP